MLTTLNASRELLSPNFVELLPLRRRRYESTGLFCSSGEVGSSGAGSCPAGTFRNRGETARGDTPGCNVVSSARKCFRWLGLDSRTS